MDKFLFDFFLFCFRFHEIFFPPLPRPDLLLLIGSAHSKRFFKKGHF